jgi:hypothetical protein
LFGGFKIKCLYLHRQNHYADETSRPQSGIFHAHNKQKETQYGIAWRYGNASKDSA